MQWEGIFSWTITIRPVSRDLWLSRPSLVIAHWVYQQKKPLEPGVSLPSNMGQNGHEKPPQVWLNLWPQGGPVNYKLALAKSIASNWKARAFAVCLWGDWALCYCSCWPSAAPEGVQGGLRHSVLQGIQWDKSLDSQIFSGIDFMLPILASPHI